LSIGKISFRDQRYKPPCISCVSAIYGKR
jgi:hypothetical protein